MITTNDITFVVTSGEGEFSEKALILLESIRKNTDGAEVVSFHPKDEYIGNDKLKKIKKLSDSHISKNKSIQDYPLSAKHVALNEASKFSDRDYLLMLDTDTVVLNDIRINDSGVDLGNRYWGREESLEEWQQVFEKFNYDFPDDIIKSTVDKKNLSPPYYKAGVILTKNNDFPRKWLDLNKKLQGNLSDSFFTDQVALALIATEYEVRQLGEKYNFPQALRLKPIQDTKIIHYHNFYSLYRAIILNKSLRGKLKSTGVFKKIKKENYKLPLNLIRETIKALYTRRID